jgi:hypothetical protein
MRIIDPFYRLRAFGIASREALSRILFDPALWTPALP